jgi:hypothetical protein
MILDKVKSMEEHLWYVQKSLENGWNREVLRRH